VENQDKIEIELATGAQLYRMNQLGILPEQSQITKQKASAVLTEARLTGKWPKERPDIGRPYDGTWFRSRWKADA
jgi:hypothetical protein